MANEIQNHHGNGWGKDSWSDASADRAINILNGARANGISAEEMFAALERLADGGQITEREFSQIRRWVEANLGSMSPEAIKAFEKFESEMQARGGRGTAEKHHSQAEGVLMNGPELQTLMEELKAMSAPPAPTPPSPAREPDRVDPSKGEVATSGSNNPSAASNPTTPPEKPAGGSSGTGNAGGTPNSDMQGYSMETLNQMERGIKPDFMTDQQWAMWQLQKAMQERSEMVGLMTQLLKMKHDMNMQIIRNISS